MSFADGISRPLFDADYGDEKVEKKMEVFGVPKMAGAEKSELKTPAKFDYDKAIEDAVHYRGSFDLLGQKISKALQSHELPDSQVNRAAVASVVFLLIQRNQSTMKLHRDASIFNAAYSEIHESQLGSYVREAIDRCFAAAGKRTLAEAINFAQVS